MNWHVIVWSGLLIIIALYGGYIWGWLDGEKSAERRFRRGGNGGGSR